MTRTEVILGILSLAAIVMLGIFLWRISKTIEDHSEYLTYRAGEKEKAK